MIPLRIIIFDPSRAEMLVRSQRVTKIVPMTERVTRISLIFSFLLFAYISVGQEVRSYDGTNNNLINTDWGSVMTQLQRVTTPMYGDGVSSPSGETRRNPREISNMMFDQQSSIFDPLSLSDYTWAFGQFIDHDISLTESERSEFITFDIPADDVVFTPGSFMATFRSEHIESTGTSPENPRQHPNRITAFIDGSAVYGSDEVRANWLRTFEDGKLKTSEGNLMPWNTKTGEQNDDIDAESPFMADDTGRLKKWFVAGDIRANENPLLIAIHTIFLREHNRRAEELRFENPTWSDEELYQQSRKYVGALIQNIVYNEWLPAQGLTLPRYTGYNDLINPGIFNVFSGAAFRLGHTLINSDVIRMDNDGELIAKGNIGLKDAFFNPGQVKVLGSQGGIDPYLKGMATNTQQKLDCKVIDDLRNFLFGAPGAGGMDLAALNIVRGRERGIADYNTIRDNFGLPRVKTFFEITRNEESAATLEEVYGTVDNIDPWVGMLGEYHMPNAMFGELLMTIIEKQFQIVRDGDRFYYLNDESFAAEDISEIEKTRFSDIIMRNTSIELMQTNVFTAMSHEDIPNGPTLEPVDLASVVYPNPTRDEASIKLFLEEDAQVRIRMVDPNGRTIIREEQSLLQGDNFIIYDLTNQPKGVYNILLETGYTYKLLKLVKQ